MQDFAVEDLHRQRGLHHALQSAFERTRAVACIGAGVEDQLAWRVGKLDRDLLVIE